MSGPYSCLLSFRLTGLAGLVKGVIFSTLIKAHYYSVVLQIILTSVHD